MRKIILALLVSGLPFAASAADNIDKQLLAMAGNYEIGKPEQRIKKITYSIAEQNNQDNQIQINQQVEKFSNVSMFSSANSHVKNKTTSVKGRPNAKSLILLNHWELRWKMDEGAFTTQNLHISPPPAQWSKQGGDFQSSAVLVDKNGRIFLKEQCRLGAQQDAQQLHSKLKGAVQQAQCKMTLNNEAGTLNMSQDFEGYYLPGAQIFIPRTLVVTNNRTGRIDKVVYQIDKIN
ncbi:hypothetical protein LVJ85_04565 [Neisseria sp. Dent CA1/247]|uniref:hypothetical protein n=1 Tax=Neisseria sp. Dent CA1/247 TaxID=2912675 RepID=UPI001FD3BD4B|nr:hypothetical protein [Neisseria sp. Dent CA1/247]UOO77750.1 hypothetical protein LVJ85_04565 [Neisseria sp. Dent CA1/247]